jgi:hypothetical protein
MPVQRSLASSRRLSRPRLGAVAAVMWVTEDSVFTPEKTLALMSEAPWFEDENLGQSSASSISTR